MTGTICQGRCWQSPLLRYSEGKGLTGESGRSCWGQGRKRNAGTKGPCWGTPLAARSWILPGPHPSLTMMATPENMTAETSCQTLHGREDRGPSVSLEVTDPITHTSQSISGCLLGHQPSSFPHAQVRQPETSHGRTQLSTCC